jgi:FixJ family two-component response regulator
METPLRTVVLIHHQDPIAQHLRDRLSAAGYVVWVFPQASDAFISLLESPASVVVLLDNDLEDPDSAGLLLARLQDEQLARHAYVILVSQARAAFSPQLAHAIAELAAPVVRQDDLDGILTAVHHAAAGQPLATAVAHTRQVPGG